MIRNTDIESFHRRIDRHIRMAEAVGESPQLATIIRMCRLKPHRVFANERFDFRTHLVERWDDEFGRYISVGRGEVELHCSESSPQLRPTVTDLFYGRSLRATAAAAQSLFLIPDEFWSRTNCNYMTAALYGRDEFLRVYRLVEGTVNPMAPLELGLPVLQRIAANLQPGPRRELGSGQWGLSWPPKRNVSDVVPDYVMKEMVTE